MIDKGKAKQARGVRVVNGGDESLRARVLARVRKLAGKFLPSVVNSDGQVDLRALVDAVGAGNVASNPHHSNNQGYELTFAGKGLARAAADSPTTQELKCEPAQSKDFDNTSNVVIRGDNLDVLKILYQNYHQRVKMIYIDPPYNTESENFVYKDNFKQSEAQLIAELGMTEETADFLQNVYGTRSHSGWLAFMYPRLKLARELLRDDGVIFISIDDNEQANLKILCDEIFGEMNFVAGLIHQKKSGGGQAKHYYKGHDNVLSYAKNIHHINGLYKKDDRKLKTIMIDGVCHWYETDVIRRVHGKYNSDEGHRNLFYEELSSDEKAKYDACIAAGDYILVKDDASGNHYVSKYGLLNEKQKLFYSILKSDKIYSLWSSDGEELFDSYGMGGGFNNPKPVDLIKLFLTNTSHHDIVLDFFAGSGTTGDAVMQLNAEDGGCRKFILVQWDEEIDANKSADSHKFCREHGLLPVISSITIERLRRAAEKIAGGGAESGRRWVKSPPPPPRDLGFGF